MPVLDFPRNPVFGQEYKFGSYIYKWDGEKWKTIGSGYNPVIELRNEIEERLSESTIHNKRIAWNLPLKFPQYEECRVIANNANYIYPQGITMDDTKIYTLWSAVPFTDKVFIVVYDKNSNYLGYHYLGVEAIGEGLHIKDNNATVADRSGNLVNFTLKGYGKERLVPTSTHAVDVYSQFFFADGKIYIETLTPEIGNMKHRSVIAVLDETTYAVERYFTVPFQYTGYITADRNELAPYFPKRQGFVMKDGYFHAYMGGYWGVGEATPVRSYQGFHVLKTSGEAVFSSIFHPDKMVDRLKSAGVKATRVENEGACVYDNKIYSITVTNNVRDAAATTEGMVIFEEMSKHKEAISFADCEAVFTPFDTERFSVGPMPRLNSNLHNPVTGAVFTSMEEIRDYMFGVGQKVFSFYSSSLTGKIKDLTGKDYPAATYVTITSLNNNTFMVESSSTTNGQTKKDFWYPKVSSDWTQGFDIRPVTEDIRAVDVLLQSVTSPTSRQLGRICGAAYGSSISPVANENKVMALDIQSAENSQPLFIGGGSGLYRSADNINFVTNSDVNALGGTVRWYINKDGVFAPYADDTYAIGSASRRASNMFSTLGVQTTSDARMKKPTVKFTDAELKAAGEIADTIGFWEWKEGGDRRHCGTTVQLAIHILKANGLDPMDYSFICYDEWEEQLAEFTEEGCEVTPYRPAGNIYSFRDSELNKFLIRGLHERMKKVEKFMSTS